MTFRLPLNVDVPVLGFWLEMLWLWAGVGCLNGERWSVIGDEDHDYDECLFCYNVRHAYSGSILDPHPQRVCSYSYSLRVHIPYPIPFLLQDALPATLILETRPLTQNLIISATQEKPYTPLALFPVRNGLLLDAYLSTSSIPLTGRDLVPAC